MQRAAEIRPRVNVGDVALRGTWDAATSWESHRDHRQRKRACP